MSNELVLLHYNMLLFPCLVSGVAVGALLPQYKDPVG